MNKLLIYLLLTTLTLTQITIANASSAASYNNAQILNSRLLLPENISQINVRLGSSFTQNQAILSTQYIGQASIRHGLTNTYEVELNSAVNNSTLQINNSLLINQRQTSHGVVLRKQLTSESKFPGTLLTINSEYSSIKINGQKLHDWGAGINVQIVKSSDPLIMQLNLGVSKSAFSNTWLPEIGISGSLKLNHETSLNLSWRGRNLFSDTPNTTHRSAHLGLNYVLTPTSNVSLRWGWTSIANHRNDQVSLGYSYTF